LLLFKERVPNETKAAIDRYDEKLTTAFTIASFALGWKL